PPRARARVPVRQEAAPDPGQPAGWVECERAVIAHRPAEHGVLLAAGDVPHANRLVIALGSYQPAVRGERHDRDPAEVSGEHGPLPARGGVPKPQLDHLILACRPTPRSHDQGVTGKGQPADIGAVWTPPRPMILRMRPMAA